MPEDETEKAGSRQERTARALRERPGKVSSEIVAENRARNQIRKKIVEAIGRGPQTVPEIAEATGLPSHEVLWHVMAMKKYGDVVEGEESGDYYQYALKQKQEKGA